MLDCKAEWLYTLKEWEPILTLERRKEITMESHLKMFVKTAEPGRNDPCPCAAARSTKESAAEPASNQYNIFYMRSPDMPDDRILNFGKPAQLINNML